MKIHCLGAKWRAASWSVSPARPTGKGCDALPEVGSHSSREGPLGSGCCNYVSLSLSNLLVVKETASRPCHKSLFHASRWVKGGKIWPSTVRSFPRCAAAAYSAIARQLLQSDPGLRSSAEVFLVCVASPVAWDRRIEALRLWIYSVRL